MLAYPYVSVAEFRAHPTYLDSNNLRVGGRQSEQDAALTNALLIASQWADDQVNMPLAAHEVVEHTRITPDRRGRLRYHPAHAPVIAVTALAVGAAPDALDVVTAPTVWIEQAGRVVVAFSPGPGTGLDSLQFGTTPGAGEQLTAWTYLAGYPTTQLAAPAEQGATTLTVRDATGIRAGTVLRLWTPGVEEAVSVAAVADGELTLAGALKAAHTVDSTLSTLPSTARQAVITYALSELMRPAGGSSVTYGDGPSPAATSKDRQRTSAGANLIAEAKRLLMPLKRIR